MDRQILDLSNVFTSKFIDFSFTEIEFFEILRTLPPGMNWGQKQEKYEKFPDNAKVTDVVRMKARGIGNWKEMDFQPYDRVILFGALEKITFVSDPDSFTSRFPEILDWLDGTYDFAGKVDGFKSDCQELIRQLHQEALERSP